MNELAVLMTAIATLMTAGAALASVVLNSRRIKVVDEKVAVVDSKVDTVGGTVGKVLKEVKTGNSQTLAQLSDAVESRRIRNIPLKKRTRLEKSHIADVEKKV